jgi:hypothetical protein
MTNDPEWLAAAHWTYIEEVLRAHGESDDVIAKCGYHYNTAFQHGWKHAMERPPMDDFFDFLS